MAEHVLINVTLPSSETSHSNEDHIVQDTPEKLSAPDTESKEEGELCTASRTEKAVHLEVPDKEEDSTASVSLLLEQESGVTQPMEKIIESPSPDDILSDITVDNIQEVCSIDCGSASTDTNEDRVLNTFLNDNFDTFQCETEEENNNEFESISYPPAFDMHVSGTGDKPYGCKFCTRRFSHRSSLYRHQKSHTGEKLYKCSECNKAFTNSSNLSVHSRIHTGEKPYECNGCGKKFTRKFALDQHLKIHKQEKLYICSNCGRSYSDYFFLMKHQQLERASVLRIPDSIIQ